MAGARVGRLAVLAAFATALVGAAPAAADEQPSIVKAYGLDWIERVRDEAWPQPKEQRPVICLLDTGVAVTPDTPDDNPAGPIVARLAIDGGTGLPQGNTFFHLHGTQMASIIAAPRNGTGTVGVFPQARIVSVRVTVGEDVFITPANVVAGVRACRRWALAEGDLAIGSVVMAESQYEQRTDDLDLWRTAAAGAAQSGGVLVAAAGNAANAAAVAPLAVSTVLSVAAGDDTGARCPFAAQQGAAVLGPGCTTDARASWPAGSSAATAATGALLAAAATRSPATQLADRLARLRDHTAVGADGSARIDGSAFAAEFVGYVEGAHDGLGPSPLAVRPVSEAADQGAGGPRIALFRPKVRSTWNGHWLTIRRLDHFRTGRLRVAVGANILAPRRSERQLVRLRLPTKPARIRVWLVSADGASWRSLSTREKVRG